MDKGSGEGSEFQQASDEETRSMPWSRQAAVLPASIQENKGGLSQWSGSMTSTGQAAGNTQVILTSSQQNLSILLFIVCYVQ